MKKIVILSLLLSITVLGEESWERVTKGEQKRIKIINTPWERSDRRATLMKKGSVSNDEEDYVRGEYEEDQADYKKVQDKIDGLRRKLRGLPKGSGEYNKVKNQLMSCIHDADMQQ